jgi:hypothetical protein
MTVQAITTVPGKVSSPVKSADYTITLSKPVATPNSANASLTAISVSLSAPDPKATIHYTLNGDIPTEASPTYTVPLTFSTSTTLKAISVRPGATNSDVLTEDYVINL